jgi:hypothetical protein
MPQFRTRPTSSPGFLPGWNRQDRADRGRLGLPRSSSGGSRRQSDQQLADLVFPDLPHDEREKERTDPYVFNVSKVPISTGEVASNTFCFRAHGDDAWLPESVWIIGLTVEGELRLLAEPNWPANQWLSTDKNDKDSAPTRCVPAVAFG